MAFEGFNLLRAEIAGIAAVHPVGRVVEVSGGAVIAGGLASRATLGDRVSILSKSNRYIGAEVIALGAGEVRLLCDGAPDGLAIGDRVDLLGQSGMLVLDAQEKGGSKAAKDIDELVGEVTGMFAGGHLDDESLDGAMKALNDAYWIPMDIIIN